MVVLDLPWRQDVSSTAVTTDGAWKEQVGKELNRQCMAKGVASTAQSPRFACSRAHRGDPTVLKTSGGYPRSMEDSPGNPSCSKGGIDGFWKARIQKELNRQQVATGETASSAASTPCATPCGTPGGRRSPKPARTSRSEGLAGTPLSSRFANNQRRPTQMGEMLKSPKAEAGLSTPPKAARPEPARVWQPTQPRERCEVGQWLGKSPTPKFVHPY
mmetsp:Transcript_71175/g.230377  ORF Transcript_71175/g.230377 Transcript_71175/m.230377 type:complete len:216 (-) Transcript_71175:133-780(-)